MTDPLDRLEQALQRQTPEPNEAARERALRLARENFLAQIQGSADEARHTSNRPERAGFWIGVTNMLKTLTTPRNLMATSALATIAIAVVVTQGVGTGVLTRDGNPDGISGYAPELRRQAEKDATVVAAESTPRVAADRGEAAQISTPTSEATRNRTNVSNLPEIHAKTDPARGRQSDEVFAGAGTAASSPAEAPLAERQDLGVSGIAGLPGSDGLVAQPQQARRAAPVGSDLMVAPAPVIVEEEARPVPAIESNTEQFPDASPSTLKSVADEPVSTFSIDVDTASYSVVRSSLTQGHKPPREAVRIEEMINYFDYDYPAPENRDIPFATSVSIAPTPWNPDTRLMHIGIQGYDIAPEDRPPLNLVFLIDTSGSMQDPTKLPLLVRSFKLLLETLTEEDSVAIVTYAGSAGTVLDPTPANESSKILRALDNLYAGGSTAGQAGLQQAYALAEQMAEDGEVSRVILATDGDFNVGISDPKALEDFIAEKRDTGTYLSVLGFGRGNYNDAIMQSLAQNGNGTAAYIDTLAEAQKVLVEEAGGALFPIAGDVKIQVEFNPAQISEYRLIGYETRALSREDFNNDAVDAGEIGAGHTVTAIYEITPKGSPAERISELRYGVTSIEEVNPSREYAFLKLRYKLPGEARSKLIETPVQPDRTDIAPSETQFAAAVAGFGELLRGSKEISDWGYEDALRLASAARGDDIFGYRAEFLNLIRLAKVAQ